MLSDWGAAGDSASGNQTRKVAPPPGVSTTSIEPLWLATMDATIARPSPLPPVSLAREVSARQKRWKI